MTYVPRVILVKRNISLSTKRKSNVFLDVGRGDLGTLLSSSREDSMGISPIRTVHTQQWTTQISSGRTNRSQLSNRDEIWVVHYRAWTTRIGPTRILSLAPRIREVGLLAGQSEREIWATNSTNNVRRVDLHPISILSEIDSGTLLSPRGDSVGVGPIWVIHTRQWTIQISSRWIDLSRPTETKPEPSIT